MASITSVGIGSGLDVNSIVTQLVALEKKPLETLQTKATSIEAKVSEFAKIQAQFAALTDVATRISNVSSWSARSSTSSNSSAATITASATAVANAFSLDVDRLASKQSLTSATMATGKLLGVGTLNIQLGTWNSDGTFAAGSASAVSVDVEATDTLTAIASKISNANAGVNASVFNDGTSERLLIQSKNTGTAAGFRIQSADTSMAGLVFDKEATKQSLSSSAIPVDPLPGAGTLSIQLGTWNSGGTSFTTGPAAVNVSILDTDTLASSATKISSANAGVNASVFNDGTDDHLLIQSNSTGAAAGFRIQSADTTMASFVFDTETSPGTGMAAPGNPVQYGQDAATSMAESDSPVQYGQNSAARINGLAVTSATNTLANNFSGVTIELLATTTTNYGLVTETKSPISMVVSEDVKPAVKNISDLVDAFNALNKMLKDLTKYDATTKEAGLFQGDSMVTGMQNVLRSLVGSTSKGATSQRLADIGLERQLDGSLSINTSKLATAANNGTTLQELFTTDNGNALTNGFALKFATLGKGVAATGGLVANKAASLQNSLDKNAKEQIKLNDRVTLFETRLRKQYTALDVQMSKLTALNTYVAQQVTLWNKSTG
jgi:flagellar hook-associated protein 2